MIVAFSVIWVMAGRPQLHRKAVISGKRRHVFSETSLRAHRGFAAENTNVQTIVISQGISVVLQRM